MTSQDIQDNTLTTKLKSLSFTYNSKPLLRIGHTLNSAPDFSSSADYAEEIGANFYQIFLGSPQTFTPKRHSFEELQELNNKLILKNIKMIYNISNLKLPSFVGNLLLRPEQVSSNIFLIPIYRSKPPPSFLPEIN